MLSAPQGHSLPPESTPEASHLSSPGSSCISSPLRGGGDACGPKAVPLLPPRKKKGKSGLWAAPPDLPQVSGLSGNGPPAGSLSTTRVGAKCLGTGVKRGLREAEKSCKEHGPSLQGCMGGRAHRRGSPSRPGVSITVIIHRCYEHWTGRAPGSAHTGKQPGLVEVLFKQHKENGAGGHSSRRKRTCPLLHGGPASGSACPRTCLPSKIKGAERTRCLACWALCTRQGGEWTL